MLKICIEQCGLPHEALFSGITTVHDLITINSLNYAKAAIRALTDTGICARFSYGYYQDQPSEEATNFDSIATLRKSITDSKRIYCHWDLPHARFLSIRCIAAIGKWHVKWDLITVHANSHVAKPWKLN